MTASMPALQRIARTTARSVCTWRRCIRGSRTLPVPRLAAPPRGLRGHLEAPRKDFAARIVQSLAFAAAIEEGRLRHLRAGWKYGRQGAAHRRRAAQRSASIRTRPSWSATVPHDIIGARQQAADVRGAMGTATATNWKRSRCPDALIATPRNWAVSRLNVGRRCQPSKRDGRRQYLPGVVLVCES
jgi:hypothetical protein